MAKRALKGTVTRARSSGRKQAAPAKRNSPLVKARQTIASQKETIRTMVRARYDAAQDTDLNTRHWSMADYLSADAALSPAVRRKLRARARYEAQNNPFVAGIAETLATDLVGKGARLRLDIPGARLEAVQAVERRFYDWTVAVDLAEKLRIMRSARVTDGDPFAIWFTNPRLRGVQLDLRPIESDQVADPSMRLDTGSVDGLKFDVYGNVVEYHILHDHPGAGTWRAAVTGGRWVPAEDVVHWPHLTRPGQHRGVGQIIPALELFALLRRFTLATVTAAEVAALFAAIMKSNLPPSQRSAEEGDGIPPFETMPLVRGMITALPDGWDATQLKAEHPTKTYAEFERRLLTQAARACNMPYIVAAMDATGANYSTMRGDYLVYRKHLDTERSVAERIVLDPALSRWLEEAMFIDGFIPDGLPPFDQWNWSWAWDEFGHIDPKKEAEAEHIRLSSHATTLARLYAARGMDWREELEQRAVEIEFMKKRGLTMADLQPAASSEDDEDQEEDEDAEELEEAAA
jgi:lambda family phage portal protein